ncbi:DUF427 domain-containing protein [Sphingomonas carotinifaciens]|uniref:DUF427 domain-containing protein n=1 Tax=Sphingomonas carotinifaciens TaxID=1166323 RepID=A0A1G7S3H1_9SPHN|nr:DUF427 domain-containing protein [Sphingomonas carotinifaciens]MWC45046.1 DUF427 domain-containing protein [Sphingomonas carotinifaciens]SDG17512.1 Nucleotidyltransferase [Sphingomonas carotinifaciens]
MVEARWNGSVIAKSDDTVIVEGNHYFPANAVDQSVLRPSNTTSICPWKGTAQYYSLHVDDADDSDAAWYYSDPRPEAKWTCPAQMERHLLSVARFVRTAAGWCS